LFKGLGALIWLGDLNRAPLPATGGADIPLDYFRVIPDKPFVEDDGGQKSSPGKALNGVGAGAKPLRDLGAAEQPDYGKLCFLRKASVRLVCSGSFTAALRF